jgi:hypothetical protein
LPLLREEGTDHQIELKEMNEKESKVLWDLYTTWQREATSVAQDINRTFE